MTGDPLDLPLHAMNPTGRFSDRAEDYVKYRPGYPAAAIDAILDGLGGAQNRPTPMAPPMAISSICRLFKPRVSFV